MTMHVTCLACFSVGWLALSSVSWSQPQVADPIQNKRDLALDDLLAERGSAQNMQLAVEHARKVGVSEQAILEARFLYHVDLLEDAEIAKMLPEFLERQKKFELEDSAIFASEEHWLSVVEYVKAIHALQNGDRKAFKKHIMEAFWLGPRQAAAFAPHIERLRHEEAMAAITINFDQRLATLDGSPAPLLQDLITDRKALLLHFWSPDSRECVDSMPDFAATAEMLMKQGIEVISLCAERSPQARKVSTEFDKGNHGSWLVDPNKDSLGLLLRVQNLPTMALIDPRGRVLFCGDPTDIQFWRALEKLDRGIKRPDIN